MNVLEETFLSEESLLRIMTYMCRSGADPIVSTLHTMLTSDIQFAMGKYGLVLFKGHVFPYTYMTVEQRHCLYLLALHAHDGQHSAYAVLENPLKFTAENGYIIFKPVHRIPMQRVFDVLILALQRSKRSSPTLCNILLQKLGAKIVLSREMLQYIYEKSKIL